MFLCYQADSVCTTNHSQPHPPYCASSATARHGVAQLIQNPWISQTKLETKGYVLVQYFSLHTLFPYHLSLAVAKMWTLVHPPKELYFLFGKGGWHNKAERWCFKISFFNFQRNLEILYLWYSSISKNVQFTKYKQANGANLEGRQCCMYCSSITEACGGGGTMNVFASVCKPPKLM